MASKKSSSSSRKVGAKSKTPRLAKAIKRKGMPKTRVAKAAKAVKSAIVKGGKRIGALSGSSKKK